MQNRYTFEPTRCKFATPLNTGPRCRRAAWRASYDARSRCGIAAWPATATPRATVTGAPPPGPTPPPAAGGAPRRAVTKPSDRPVANEKPRSTGASQNHDTIELPQIWHSRRNPRDATLGAAHGASFSTASCGDLSRRMAARPSSGSPEYPRGASEDAARAPASGREFGTLRGKFATTSN